MKRTTLISLFVLFSMLLTFAAEAAEFPDPAEFNPVWESAAPGTSFDR